MEWVTAGVMTNAVFRRCLAFTVLLLLGSLLIWLSLSGLETVARQDHQGVLRAEAEQLALILRGDQRFLREVDERRAISYYFDSISVRPVLDGLDDDWSVLGLTEITSSPRNEHLANPTSLVYDLKLAADLNFLYLHYRVKDDSVVFRNTARNALHRADHIQISLIDQYNQFRRFTLATEAPGYIEANEVGKGLKVLRSMPSITGRWLLTKAGYNVEVQIPKELLGLRFSTLIADADDLGLRPCCYIGRSDTEQPDQLGYLVEQPTPLAKLVAELGRPIELSNPAGLMLARGKEWPDESYMQAIVPIKEDSLLLGYVSLRESTVAMEKEWAERKVLLATFALIIFCLILIYGWYSDYSAKRRKEKLVAELDRVTNYNNYLERFASRLNHELQTPVSIVRSSLEQLDSETPDRVYLERATEGLRRLSSILNKMSEARHLEETLDEDEIIRFDLVTAVKGCFEGYRLVYPEYELDLIVESSEIPVTGIPELIAQGLDKIVDNAVEFSTDKKVWARVGIEGENAVINLRNEGPTLPGPESVDLFESMVSVRNSATHHLGMGLYVAKTIIEYHGGSITLKNSDDNRGVVAEIRLPILRLTSKLLPRT